MKNLPMPFTIKVHDFIDILIAPQENPLSAYEPIRRGESALNTAIRRWNLTGRQEISSVNIHMPSEQVKAQKLNQISEQLYHYFEGKLQDNNDSLLLFKKNLIRVFRNAFIFLTLCMGLVAIIANEAILPNMPTLVRSVLKEGFTVIGWVVMWRPTELAINAYGKLKKEHIIYQKLLNVPINLIADDNF